MACGGCGRCDTAVKTLADLRCLALACPAGGQVGEMATWEKLAAIECNCSIEATLDKCLANMTNQVGLMCVCGCLAFACA